MKTKFILVIVFWIVFFGVAKANTIDDYKKACDDGFAWGCSELGVMYDKGEGVKQDHFAAADLYKKACDGGDVGGCFSLGHSYENGQGVRQNSQKALELFGQSCDMRHQKSCDAYAQLKKRGSR